MKFRTKQLLLIIPFVWALVLFEFALYGGGDNALVLILAKSIAVNHSYAEIHLPGDPPATIMPPVLPVILSPLVAMFGHDYLPSKLIILLFYGVSIAFCFLLFRKLSEERPGNAVLSGDLIILVYAYAFNFIAVEHSHYILTEIPYLAFSLVSVFLFLSFWERKRSWMLFAAIFTAILAFHTRTIGVTLILAELIVLLRKDRKLFGIALVLVALLALPWTIRNRLVAEDRPEFVRQFLLRDIYAPDLGRITFQDLLGRISSNATGYALRVYDNLLTSKNFGPLVSLPLFGITVVGIVDILKSPRTRVIGIYLVFYFISLLLWISPGSRYALPMLPFLLLGLYLGLKRISARGKKRYRIPAILFLILLIPNLHSGYVRLPLRWKENSAWLSGEKLDAYPHKLRNYITVAEFAKGETPEDAIFCARKPRLFYWFSERKTTIYPYSFDKDRFREFFTENQIRYIVLDSFDQSTRTYLWPVVVEMQPQPQTICETRYPPTIFLLEIVE